MKANELRIGNLVYTNSRWDKNGISIVNKISAIDIQVRTNGVYQTYYLHEQINPIPLTEEWLVRLGFEEYIDFGEKTGCFDKTPLCGFSYSVNSNKVSIMEKGNHISHWIEREIKYVHELQNLYFSIKGEELTIKN